MTVRRRQVRSIRSALNQPGGMGKWGRARNKTDVNVDVTERRGKDINWILS